MESAYRKEDTLRGEPSIRVLEEKSEEDGTEFWAEKAAWNEPLTKATYRRRTLEPERVEGNRKDSMLLLKSTTNAKYGAVR